MICGVWLCIGPCKQRPYTMKHHADGDCAGNNNHADLLRFSGWCRRAGKQGGVHFESADEAVLMPVIFGAIDEVNEAAQTQPVTCSEPDRRKDSVCRVSAKSYLAC